MQYILTEQEYQAFTTKGNVDNHKKLMEVIDILHVIGDMKHMPELCLTNFLALTEKLKAYQEHGDFSLVEDAFRNE